jgi:hypothetical protein
MQLLIPASEDPYLEVAGAPVEGTVEGAAEVEGEVVAGVERQEGHPQLPEQ